MIRVTISAGSWSIHLTAGKDTPSEDTKPPAGLLTAETETRWTPDLGYPRSSP